MSFTDIALLLVVGLVSGAVNAIAGGGTLLTFPVLVSLGVPVVSANATTTVGLVPGAMASGWAYRDSLSRVGGWLRWLGLISLAGGLLGAGLLLVTPDGGFERMAPWLVLVATVLFAWGGVRPAQADAWIPGSVPPAPLLLKAGVFVVSVYGGYFGGGLGILMLALMSVFHAGGLDEANAVKSFTGSIINGIAAAVFLAKGIVVPEAAVALVAGSILGGYAGVRLARRVGPRPVRVFVVCAGLAASIRLFLK